MVSQKFIRGTLKLSFIFNTIAALSVAFPDSVGKFADLPDSGSIFYSALLALLIFVAGIIYLRIAYSEWVDVPLLIIAGVGKIAVFFIALYCFIDGIISFPPFALAIGDLLFGFIFLCWIMFARRKGIS